MTRRVLACGLTVALAAPLDAGPRRSTTRDFPVPGMCPAHYGWADGDVGGPPRLREELVFRARSATARITFAACDNRSANGFGQQIAVDLDDVAVVRKDVFDSHQVAASPSCYAEIQVNSVFDRTGLAPFTSALPFFDSFDGAREPCLRGLPSCVPSWILGNARIARSQLVGSSAPDGDGDTGNRLILADDFRDAPYLDDAELSGAWYTEPSFSWSQDGSFSHSPSNSLFTPDPANASQAALVFPTNARSAPLVPRRRSVLSFWHRLRSENAFDGGVLEYSPDAGDHWFDILAGDGDGIPANAGRFLAGSYNTTGLVNDTANPLAGRAAWSRTDTQFSETRVDLADFADRAIWLRWRFGSDASVGGDGWWVDDVSIDPLGDAEPGQDCSSAVLTVTRLTPGADYVVDFLWSVNGFVQNQSVLTVAVDSAPRPVPRPRR